MCETARSENFGDEKTALRKIPGEQLYEMNKTKRMCQITYGKKKRRLRTGNKNTKKQQMPQRDQAKQCYRAI